MRLLIFLAAFVVGSASAAAQTSTESVSPAKWDVAATLGSFNGHVDRSAEDRYADTWVNTWLAGITIGRYVTTHLKAEIEWTASGEDERYRTRALFFPTQPTVPFHYNFEEATRARQVSATVVWQFYENQWAHPFIVLGGGVQMVKARALVYPTTFFVGSPATRVDVTPPPEPDRSYTAAQAILGVGGKLYFTTHAFVRPELRLGLEQHMSHLSFRFGVGVDF